MIELRNLRKSYNDTVAVDGISLKIERGETFGMLGPNGAGKTTTVNMMVGVLKPDSGEVIFDGHGDPMRPEIRMQSGNAPQSLSIYDDLSADENLRFFGRLYGLSGSKLKERVNWALDFAGLTDRRKDIVKTYSGGMQRRLNLVCALIHDPKIIVLDEPTVGVDPQSRNLIFDKIEMLKKQNRTIIYTTHYMEEAERLCDRVAIIDHGKILDIDTVDNLIEKHGGLSVIEAELTAPPEDPSQLPGTLDGTSLRVETDRPMEIFAEIAGSGLKFLSIKLERADLEAVFLNLTGRRLRD
ncbi:MAG: ABC transporter ATP-binding protein [Candidatus Zixiibacteriota bacterium]